MKTLKHRQSGAILVVSLLLLLVMTLLGLAAMQVTRMEERMAGNARDVNLAFQGAETGLRDGEDQLNALTAVPDTCSASPCVFWQRDVTMLASDLRDQTPAWWHSNAQESGVDSGTVVDELAEAPRFMVQEIVFIDDDLVTGEGIDTGRTIYRVVGESAGSTSTSRAIVETTFAKRFN